MIYWPATNKKKSKVHKTIKSCLQNQQIKNIIVSLYFCFVCLNGNELQLLNKFSKLSSGWKCY